MIELRWVSVTTGIIPDEALDCSSSVTSPLFTSPLFRLLQYREFKPEMVNGFSSGFWSNWQNVPLVTNSDKIELQNPEAIDSIQDA